MANWLIENVLKSIMGEGFDGVWHSSDDFSNEGLLLILLQHSELFWGRFANLEERVACHLHDAWICLFHELKQFSDDCLQEVPVHFEKIRVLSYHIHDTWCNYSFVLLSFLGLAEMQKGPQSIDKESAFLSFLDAAAEWADDPWEWVEFIEAELIGLLFFYFVEDELFHLWPIVLH